MISKKVISMLVYLVGALNLLNAQQIIKGVVADEKGNALPFANVLLKESKVGVSSDEHGDFLIETNVLGEIELQVSYVGYLSSSQKLVLSKGEHISTAIFLTASPELYEVVITGTMSEMSRSESPVPVEVYSPSFFEKNPNPSIYESMHAVNGVRPQLNCNVCNTGDIHINGLEGAYTMVLIDGMPLVSGLSTVYGLMGIPNAMVERIEIVKGPSSTIYGSEAIGGVINVITKSPEIGDKASIEIATNSWLENNVDIGINSEISDKVSVLNGISLFHYQNARDDNNDNFTDISLSKRLSLFQKWNFKRRKARLFSVGLRYYYEDRWGGEMQWTPEYRGSDSIYGESIHTNRYEIYSIYQLPTREKMSLTLSYNRHDQNSYYGRTSFIAQQDILFTQFIWDKRMGTHNTKVGVANRYVYYDDNTVATEVTKNNEIGNSPNHSLIPGLFIQDDIELSKSSRILLGMRYDYHSIHGNIWTPRMAYKYKINEMNSFRINAGTGYRVVNIFTEDHAALSGSRDVEVLDNLSPEKSVNLNVNYLKKIFTNNGNYFSFDLSFWHSRFSNKIVADYDQDPNKIIYENLLGYAISQGGTVNIDALINKKWRILCGLTLMDNFQVEQNLNQELNRVQPILTERYSGSWAISYSFTTIPLSIDYTGNLYGPMRLPLLSETDPRPEFSPIWSLHNIKLTLRPSNEKWEVYTGLKNLFNFLPPSNSIARAADPFDKEVEYDSNGGVNPTKENPYALTFDPSYVYAPNQGIRAYVGLKYQF